MRGRFIFSARLMFVGTGALGRSPRLARRWRRALIKSVLGFRQFLLRGLEKVKGEWSLVTMAWNMTRMFVLKAA
jgi:hypothetical protein